MGRRGAAGGADFAGDVAADRAVELQRTSGNIQVATDRPVVAHLVAGHEEVAADRAARLGGGAKAKEENIALDVGLSAQLQ